MPLAPANGARLSSADAGFEPVPMQQIAMTKTFFAALLVLASGHALAMDPRPIEQRFSAAQLGEAGLDTLSPPQLAALDRLLRNEADAMANASSAGVDPVAARTAPVTAPVKADSARDAGLLEGATDGPI